METETSFGALISRRRKALGLLQKELALQVGCSVTAVQKIERDERRPSRAMAERLAEALDVPADERATFVLVARGERLVERLLPVSEPILPIADAATRAWTRRAAGFADDAVRPRYGTGRDQPPAA